MFGLGIGGKLENSVKVVSGCARCMGEFVTGVHCCYCDTELGDQIEQLQKKTSDLEQRLKETQKENKELTRQVGHWKANHKYAIECKRKLSDKYGDILMENRLLAQELINERTEREGRQAETLLSRLKNLQKKARSYLQKA